ncbi:MAG: HAD family hydrolase [bacterium]|nr:HAD family hydrolase [bacterium]MDZ4295940.1 HAD family hydrolase [Patescibacteria group bacterium]
MQTKNDKVIFFDCYQTLLDVRLDKENQKVDERRGWEEFVNLLAKNHGVKIGATDFVVLLEKRKAYFYSDKDKTTQHHNLCLLVSEVLEKDLQTPLPKDEVSRLIYEYRKISRGYVRLYPKVADTLAVLSEKYTLSIASYTQGCFTQLELRELEIEKYFSYFVYSSDIAFKKESPEFYRECLRLVQKKPEHCVMIGDNYREDISVPTSLGIHTVWIKNPDTSSKHSDLPTTGTKGVIDLKEFDILPEVIDGIFKN